MESGRESKKEIDVSRDGDRTKTAVPGELHVVNKCLWNKDLKGERVRDGSGLRGGFPAPDHIRPHSPWNTRR